MINLKTLMGWAAIAFVIFLFITNPTNITHLVHNIGAFLSSSAMGLSDFVKGI